LPDPPVKVRRVSKRFTFQAQPVPGWDGIVDREMLEK
jgi:hypothetical protein